MRVWGSGSRSNAEAAGPSRRSGTSLLAKKMQMPSIIASGEDAAPSEIASGEDAPLDNSVHWWHKRSGDKKAAERCKAWAWQQGGGGGRKMTME
mmetsp:Transcript_32531/g.41922  ORF Transcript_32531/g.41922 Transcript_32531/m.41922 type:complete len:94 (+) Transcript_32531:243-524(+)